MADSYDMKDKHLKFLNLLAQLNSKFPIPYNRAIIYNLEELLKSFHEQMQPHYGYLLCSLKRLFLRVRCDMMDYEVLEAGLNVVLKSQVHVLLDDNYRSPNSNFDKNMVYVALSNKLTNQYRVLNVSKNQWAAYGKSEDVIVEIGADGWVLMAKEKENEEFSEIYFVHVFTCDRISLPDIQLIVKKTKKTIHGCHSRGATMVVNHWRHDSIMVYRHFANRSFWTASCVEVSAPGVVQSKTLLDFGYLCICCSRLVCLFDWEKETNISLRVDVANLPQELVVNRQLFLVSSSDVYEGFLLSVHSDGKRTELWRLCNGDSVKVHRGLTMLMQWIRKLHHEEALETIEGAISIIKSGFDFYVDSCGSRMLQQYSYFVACNHMGYASRISPFELGDLYLSGFTNDVVRFSLEDEDEDAQQDEGEDDNNMLTIMPCPFGYCSCFTGWVFQ